MQRRGRHRRRDPPGNFVNLSWCIPGRIIRCWARWWCLSRGNGGRGRRLGGAGPVYGVRSGRGGGRRMCRLSAVASHWDLMAGQSVYKPRHRDQQGEGDQASKRAGRRPPTATRIGMHRSTSPRTAEEWGRSSGHRSCVQKVAARAALTGTRSLFRPCDATKQVKCKIGTS
jgi:hypothetical protein